MPKSEHMQEPKSLTYDEFAEWHLVAEKRLLEPARLAAVRLLNEILDNTVTEIDRPRFRISGSRVKSPQRTFAKLSNDKYRTKFQTYDSVPDIIDDLVGLRLVCNNLSDINTFQEIIGELPVEDGSGASLSVEADSQRDYFSDPKASGYRAFHVNFVVPIPQARAMKRLRVEVQVRTLLQDGWGELTHEDSYKPGSTVPDWIVRMSQRMAELLAAVDSIAQDLRNGLDIETQRQADSDGGPLGPEMYAAPSGTGPISEGSLEFSAGGEAEASESGQLAEALLKEAQKVVGAVERPTALAVISQDLIGKFGNEIAGTWAQFGGFKKFLQIAVPPVVITGPQPGYLHPLNEVPPDDWELELDGSSPDWPSFARSLRTYEKGMPLISSTRMSQLASALESALSEELNSRSDSGRVSRTQIGQLAKRARELGEENGQLVIRPHAEYVLRILSNYELLVAGMTASQIMIVMVAALLRSAQSNRLVTDHDSAKLELSRWLLPPAS